MSIHNMIISIFLYYIKNKIKINKNKIILKAKYLDDNYF